MSYLSFLLPLFLFLTSYNGGEMKNEQSQTTDTQQTVRATKSQEVRTIHIIGINQMKFAVKEEGEAVGTGETVTTPTGETYLLLESIKAAPGETLHIKLTTVTKLPGAAMSHNWVLLKQGSDPAAFASAAISAKANDYIPTDLADQVIAHTGLAAGGETVEVTFTVPDKTGSYDYLCTFPAHFMAGMKGKLIVE